MEQTAATVRFRAWADSAETKVNTHPIAYIGADSKGLDLLLYAPGPKNQDGHGTYPFVGIYEGIGLPQHPRKSKRSSTIRRI